MAERENTIKTLSRLQITYDTELDNVRKILEDSEKDRAKLEMSNLRLQKDMDDMKTRYVQKLEVK